MVDRPQTPGLTKFTEECTKGQLTREELVTVLRYTGTWQAKMKGTTANECGACGNSCSGPTPCCPGKVVPPPGFIDPW
eukprot:COSAG03_NODE_6262_length_1088_cov_1.224469_1_plen_78_part_00